MPQTLGELPFAHVLPRNATLSSAGRLAIGGCDIRDLAEEHGTPLYVFDEDDFRETCREYRREFSARWEDVRVAYAAKAFLSTRIARMVADEGLGMDVVSGGELAVARRAGFPPEDVYFHGNNKQPDELQAALDWGIGHVVVDSFFELELLNRLALEKRMRQVVMLRISPNVDPHTHAATTTGILDSKFGFAIANGDAERAVGLAMGSAGLDLRGIHVHLGSPVFETEPFAQASVIVAGFAARMGDLHGFEMTEYSPGGGYALAYTRDQRAPSISEYADALAGSLEAALAEHRLATPSIHIEPGRSLIGRAMMAVYRVGARKEIPGVRTYVSVDGGMADNIRPAIYGSRYEAISVDRPLADPEETVTLAGKYCESGDVLIRDAHVPRFDTGELIGVPASGAYHLSMSSNYNFALKPPLVAISGGQPNLIQRRETVDDLLARDL